MKFTSYIASLIFKAASKSTFSKFNKMNAKQLLALLDADLLMAIVTRTDSHGNAAEEREALAALSGAQLAAYAVALFDMEAQNGGLFQYFCNTSRFTAPYLADALKVVGAPQTEKLFTGFVSKHNINISNLSEFDIKTEEEYDKKFALYPFEEIDSKFSAAYETENLEALAAAFIREHIADFA